MRALNLLGVVLGTSICAYPAMAQLPPDQTVQLRFHESPTDPESAIDFYVIATLEATELDGNDVGWTVTQLEFFQTLGNDTKTWVETYPVLDTIDGLWWVTHLDPQAPDLTEFLTTPLLQGRALAGNPSVEDLDYEIVSTEATPYAPYEKTASVTYAMAAAGTNEPVKQGTNEPVETHDDRDRDSD